MEFYRNAYFARLADTKHQWITKVLDDGTLKVRFMQVGRTIDGRLEAYSGTEYATANAYGLITSLRADGVLLESWG